MTDLRSLAHALDGDVVGRQVLCPGPGHSRKDRSLSVTFGPQGPVVHSHAGDDWRACRDYVLDRLGIERPKRDRAARPLQDALERMRARVQADQRERATRAERIAKAQALWATGDDPRNSIVEAYLRGRGLDLPDDIAGAVLRFHPAVPWREDGADRIIRVPAMLAAMRNIETNDVTAVHRTRLTADGEKVAKRMAGVAQGAAIKLDPDAAINDELVVGEGIETTLSGRQLGFRPAWAMGSVGAIAALPVLVRVQRLGVLEEIDDSGASARALEQVGRRWVAHGREVVAIQPAVGRDMNDAVRGGG